MLDTPHVTSDDVQWMLDVAFALGLNWDGKFWAPLPMMKASFVTLLKGNIPFARNAEDAEYLRSLIDQAEERN